MAMITPPLTPSFSPSPNSRGLTAGPRDLPTSVGPAVKPREFWKREDEGDGNGGLKRRAIFLDRDGVINRSVTINGKPYPPANLAAMEILPGVPQALKNLAEAGYLLIVITNQPDVSRGITPRETVEEINNYLFTHLPIDDFRTCFHADEDACGCRKPLPGALLEAAKMHKINLEKSYMIGDRWKDVEAGQNAGCQTIFIDYGYAEKQPTTMNFRVQTLMEAAQIILGENA